MHKRSPLTNQIYAQEDFSYVSMVFLYQLKVLGGDVLDLLLFLIFINSLPMSITLRYSMFKDDVTLIFPSEDITTLKEVFHQTVLETDS